MRGAECAGTKVDRMIFLAFDIQLEEGAMHGSLFLLLFLLEYASFFPSQWEWGPGEG
jgi:hypothetical protein